jgi:outer membrane protein TolC
MSNPPSAPLRGSRGPLLATACALSLLAGAPLRAQEATPANGVTLREALRAAATSGAAVQIAEQDVRMREGALTSARGYYATQFGTSVNSSQKDSPGGAALAEQPGAVASQRTTSYQAAVTRVLPVGATVQTGVTLSHVANDMAAPATSVLPANQAGVSLRMDVPVWRDRGGVALRANERVARLDLHGGTLELEHATASAALETASAFWDYLAAQQRLDVQRQAEARAERLSNDVRALIRADERPPADLNQTLASLSSRHIARIAAEQAVVEARQRLGRAMGMSADEVAALPAAAGAFPAAAPFAPGTEQLQRMVAEAYAGRRDLAAAEQRVGSSAVALAAARNGVKPRLDLQLGVGYTGLTSGSGLNDVVGPFYRDAPGMNASVGVSYSGASSNPESRGRVLQQAAVQEQRRIAARDLRARIGARVAASAEALRRSVLALAHADESVELSRRMVENEQSKNRLGANTLFEVILAEDGLTNALLSRVAAQMDHALAIARLRFETGALAAASDAAQQERLLAETPATSPSAPVASPER